jgi:aryl-alcohol dehydrogenase-like predicted oxidoreductase
MSIGTRPLGSTGLAITEVGFGAWAIGGGEWTYGWGSQDDASSIRALLHAAELGVNCIDTAPVYGYGRLDRAPDVSLSAQDLEDITRAIERTGVGAGPIDVLATVG